MPKSESQGYYIALLSIHGLIRGENLELGRDADTGGQTKYVVELARSLSEQPSVDRVDLFTRMVIDQRVDDSYAVPEEQIAPKAYIIRLPCGPRRYLRKEVLWPYLDEFADQAIKHFRKIERLPDVIHAHYADAGYVGVKLNNLLGLPLVFTGHSLGREKKRRLMEKGMSEEKIVQRYNINERIEAEENALNNASMVVASTHQEVEEQYKQYEHYPPNKMRVIPPGVDLNRFSPPDRKVGQYPYAKELLRFLRHTHKPMILALSRPDERKNITTLIHAYGNHPELKELANLVVIAGSRDDLQEMDRGSRSVLWEILYLVDKYDLYGKMAYPKKHHPDEVSDIYRIAAATRGVFINPALTEPFGLTLIEAAASGLPIVATNDGGPRDIIAHCKNGELIDPLDQDSIAQALIRVLQDRRTWSKLARNGIRGVEKHYSWSGHAKTYLEHVRKFMKQKKQRPFWYTSGKKLLQADRLIVADVDNTLVGDDEALQDLTRQLRECPYHIGFAIATGRLIEPTLEVLEKNSIPRPDVLITSAGSEIYYGHDLRPDTEWRKHINYRWHREYLKMHLQHIPGLTLQPDEYQHEFKLSYYIDTSEAPKVREIVRSLRKHHFHAKVVFSLNQYLDFLPMRASKGLAVWYLSNRWGIPMDHIMVAGDSGNDEEMLTSNALAMVVGNHSKELKHLKKRPGIYFAQGHYARGILEGIEHFNFFGEIQIPEGYAS